MVSERHHRRADRPSAQGPHEPPSTDLASNRYRRGTTHPAKEVLLESMFKIGHELEEIGITGYPEGHPFLRDETLRQALYEKRPYSTYIVSQICFDPETTSGWIRGVRERGVELPIYIGIPGAVSKRKLMQISSSIGVGGSADFLKKHGNWFVRLLLPGGYNPDDLVKELGPYLGDPDSGVEGFHIYTFNEVKNTEAWRLEMLERIERAEG